MLSRQLYTDATPTAVAAYAVGQPPASVAQHYCDSRPIAFAEMATALKGLIWYMQYHLTRPTTITFYTDSSVVYATLVKGTGLTLRSSAILQQ